MVSPRGDGAVVVIGSAGGIGGAIVRRLAAAGRDVVCADRNGTGASLAAAGVACLRAVDVRDPASVAALRDWAAARAGGVDAVINCAAILHPGAAGTVAPDIVRDEVATNLLGTIHVAHAFVPYFRVRRRGHLVLFASLGGIVPMPGGAVYAATKFGVRGFALSLAAELRGTGVRVSLVSPDSTETPMLRTEARLNGSPMSFTSVPLDPDTVARAVERTLRRPRPETLVPRGRGLIARLIAWSPAGFAALAPALEWLGRRGKTRYLLEAS